VEILLLLSIAVHSFLSVRLIFRKRAQLSKLPLWSQLHRLTGWYLLATIFVHIFFVRFLGAAPRAAGIGFTLTDMPILFYPYYAGDYFV
jgi:succinate dehydrogenase/fumarate reductase cytochrome b subunit